MARVLLNDGKCIFCDRPVPEKARNLMVQVVFGGVRVLPHGGRVIGKDPGDKVAVWHAVCGVPENLE